MTDDGFFEVYPEGLFAAIKANAMRSVLTTLGIIIGVAAVISMVSLGEGASQQIEEQIEGMGTNVLSISPKRSRGMGGVASGSTRLYLDDAVALRDNSGGLLKVAPEVSSNLQVTYLRWNDNLQIYGTWPEWFELNNMELEHGRMFDLGEIQGRRAPRSAKWIRRAIGLPSGRPPSRAMAAAVVREAASRSAPVRTAQSSRVASRAGSNSSSSKPVARICRSVYPSAYRFHPRAATHFWSLTDLIPARVRAMSRPVR